MQTIAVRKPSKTAIPQVKTAQSATITQNFTNETGLYYYGARDLDPKTSRWLSGDPALGEYVPSAPVNDEAKKRNGSLPGQGGVFNYVNLHVYHYAGNNPVKYTDPDGEVIAPVLIKLLVDAGKGAVTGAAVATSAKYLATSIIRFMNGESLESAFTPREGDWAEYGKTALKGAGSGAASGLLSNIPIVGKVARTGRIGNGLSTGSINMLSTMMTTIAGNIFEGKSPMEDLKKEDLFVSFIIGFATGIVSPHDMPVFKNNGFNPVTGTPYHDGNLYFPTQDALRAKLLDIIGNSIEETLNAIQDI
jgi:hypothetical protein